MYGPSFLVQSSIAYSKKTSLSRAIKGLRLRVRGAWFRIHEWGRFRLRRGVICHGIWPFGYESLDGIRTLKETLA